MRTWINNYPRLEDYDSEEEYNAAEDAYEAAMMALEDQAVEAYYER